MTSVSHTGSHTGSQLPPPITPPAATQAAVMIPLNQVVLSVMRHLHGGGIHSSFLGASYAGAFEIKAGRLILGPRAAEFCASLQPGDWIAISRDAGVFEVSRVDARRGVIALGSGDVIGGSNDAADSRPQESFGRQSENFTGQVWRLRLPAGFVAVCRRIRAYIAANPPTNITSESVAGLYSVTFATDAKGAPAGWQAVFDTEICHWRRMFFDVQI